jgi:predicted amidohydrolase YtcJ
MTIMRTLCAAALLTAGVSLTAAAPPHVDRIFVNARIWTGDEARPEAEALAISGDRIVAVGSAAEAKALAAADTVVVDLGGRRVVPGFNDAHLHFPGPPVNEIDLAGADSLAELQGRLRDYAKAHPAAPWVLGRGWGYSAFPGGKPDKKYLDEVVSDRLVYLSERDGHMGLANSRALAIAGITRATPDPPNGRIVRDPGGEPTGELQEAAQDLVGRHIPSSTFDETYAAFRQHIDEAASYGLTSVQNASWSPTDQRLAERALAEGALTLRFRFAVPILPKEGGAPEGHVLKTPLTPADLANYRELRDTFRGPLLTYGAIKGFVDGTVDARTAAMFEPYVGAGGTGIPFWDQADLNATVALYDREGFQVLLHAVGDKAIHMALDAYEYAAKTNGTSGRRHRIEHVEVPALADLPRFGRLGVLAVTQPMFANPDATTLGNFAVLLGPARAAHADSFTLFDDAGAVQAFGSDWPVFTNEPLKAIYCAVTRMTPEGTPAGGWYPLGRVSVEAALRHYTRDAAYASFDEAIKGTLSPGKLADLVVLSDDILGVPPARILKTRVLLTVMGGKDTYRADDLR